MSENSEWIAVKRGVPGPDGEQLWGVIEGHEIDGTVIAEDLSEEHAKLIAAAPAMRIVSAAVADSGRPDSPRRITFADGKLTRDGASVDEATVLRAEGIIAALK